MNEQPKAKFSPPTTTSARCRSCGAEIPLEARFCIACGRARSEHPRPWDSEPPGASPDPIVGRIVADRYRVLSLLGQGGMGVVYKVEHVHIGKVMAMKLLHGELARSKEMLRRFRREAEAASHLGHVHTVQVFDFGESQGLVYLVMEYVDGRTLDDIIEAEGPLPFARVARIAAQVCSSVGEAHALGIVHRDIKPENVMVTRHDGADMVKVLDFGLAKLRDASSLATVTTTGMIVGTPHYMPPEQIRGEAVDGRGDIYAIGAMIYRACTGVPPFDADVPVAVLTKHLTEPVVPPSQVSRLPLPPEADAIVLKALEKDPADRFQTTAAMREALVAYMRSAGEDLTDPSLRIRGLEAAVATPAQPARPKLTLATREDVDPPERRRAARRGLLGSGLVLVALAIAGLAAYAFVTGRLGLPLHDPGAEREPNDELADAGRLREGVVLRGHIGERASAVRGDEDVFRLEGSERGGRPIALELLPLPNMDLEVQIFRDGEPMPILTLDSGGVGEGESAPNLAPTAKPYVVRVREKLSGERLPTENVSDEYALSWHRAELAPGLEHEPNDSLEDAERIALGQSIEGYIGWAGDADAHCLDGAPGSVLAEVSGIAGVDVVLRWVDRVEAISRRVNHHGIGEGETSPPVMDAQPGRTCFEVSARRQTAGSRPSRSDLRYRLTVLPAPPPAL